MIYVASSVLLADLFAEPPVSTRDDVGQLLAYEVWNRINAYCRTISHGDRARALEPFPLTVRTLDAPHLATMDFLRKNGEWVELASYDNRLLTAAQALGIPLAAL